MVFILGVLSACLKEEGVSGGTPQDVTSRVSFERTFAGAMISAAQCPDGGYFVLMDAVPPYAQKRLVKVDSTGEVDSGFDPIWLPGVEQGPAAPTDDGGCISIVSHYEHLIVARLDAMGSVVTSRAFDFSGWRTPSSIVRTGPSTWLISGYDQYTVTVDTVTHLVQDIWAMSVDQNGDSIWKSTFSDPRLRWITNSTRLANGDALVTMYHVTHDGVMLNALRIAPNGEQIWCRDIGSSTGFGNGIGETPTGQLVFAASKPSGASDLQGVVYATNPAGDALWERTFGRSDMREWVFDVALGPADRLLVTGYATTTPNSFAESLFVAGVNATGTLLWTNYATGHDSIATGMRIFPTSATGFTILGRVRPDVNGGGQWSSFLKDIGPTGAFD